MAYGQLLAIPVCRTDAIAAQAELANARYNASLSEKRVADAAHRTRAPQDRQAASPNAVVTLCAGLIIRFGGIDQLCQEWHEHLIMAADEHPGSKRVLDALRAIARMIEVADLTAQKMN